MPIHFSKDRMLEVLDESGDNGDDHQGRRDDTQSRHDPAGDAAGLLSHKGRGIYRNDAGGTLSDGIIIHQLFIGAPAPLFHHFPLQHGQHGIAAAKGQAADAGKGEKQI